MQYTYKMKLKGEFPIDLADELGITNEDLLMYNQSGVIPLTKKAYMALKANRKLVESISINTDATYGDLYPLTPIPAGQEIITVRFGFRRRARASLLR